MMLCMNFLNIGQAALAKLTDNNEHSAKYSHLTLIKLVGDVSFIAL